MQVAVNVIMKEDNDSDTRHGLLETVSQRSQSTRSVNAVSQRGKCGQRGI